MSLAHLLPAMQGMAMLCTPNMSQPLLFLCGVFSAAWHSPAYLCLEDLFRPEVMSRSLQMRGDWPGCSMLHASWQHS